MEPWLDRLAEALPRLRAQCPHQFLARLTAVDHNCFRFANSRGTQNTSVEDMELELVVAEPARGGAGAKVATVAASEFAPEKLLKQALRELKQATVNEEFSGFCPPGLRYGYAQGFFPATAALGSEEKARRLEALRQKEPDLWWGGIFETATSLRVVGGSNGLFLSEHATQWQLEVKLELDGRSVSVWRSGRDAAHLDLEAEVRPSIETLRRRPPRQADLPDGAYTLLLGPEAASEVAFYLAFLGFGGRGHKQGRNFTCAILGKSLFENPRVRLVDDGQDARTLTRWFDGWGFPRRKLCLLDGGRVVDLAHDLFTAPRPEDNTGHGDGGSPYPMLMELSPGDTAAADLPARHPGAVVVSRFHYPTVADPCRPLIKGSTKDGTYLLTKDGPRDLGGLEFYFNPVQLLASVVDASREQYVVPQGSLALSLPGANIVPWLAVEAVQVKRGTLYKD